MAGKIPCIACEVLILPATAKKNEGLCMPCFGGYRASIEKSKIEYQKQREYEQSPEGRYRKWLISYQHKSVDSLSYEEKLYILTEAVVNDLYENGFFYVECFAYDPVYYEHAVLGLTAIGAIEAAKVLVAGKNRVFENYPIPSDENEEVRRSFLPFDLCLASGLEDEDIAILEEKFNDLDTEFRRNIDQDYTELMADFVRHHELCRKRGFF